MSNKANILLVDDRPENLVALEAVLEPLEHNLVKAHSGEEALKHLLNEDFSVILLDVQMPGMDGFETALQIKQREKTRDVPIIFLTAISREPRHALRGYSSGAVDYIAKPFEPNALRAKVSVFIELHEKNELLKQQAAELQRSNQDLQQFAYVASHDLREPIRVMCGYLDLLAEDYASVLDDSAKKYIEAAMGAGTRMTDLIDDLLRYSRVGADERVFEPIDLRAVIDEACENLSVAIQETGANITTDELPTVTSNASLLVQLFQNLLANALKFRAEAAPRIHVGATRQDGEWSFTIADNGIGFDPASASRIFDIFTRLHGRSKHEGTGIGLAICKRIVEQHGGEIWADSKPGTGTTFSFTIPDRVKS